MVCVGNRRNCGDPVVRLASHLLRRTHPDGRAHRTSKTLTAFLVFIVRLMARVRQGTLLYLIYFSPLYVFVEGTLSVALQAFAADFNVRRLLTQSSRLSVRVYPKEAAPALEGGGFVREMQDYALHRGV